MKLNLFNNANTIEEIENNKDMRRFISEETIERAKLLATLLDQDKKYKIIPRMSGVITFEWKRLPSDSRDVEEVRRERIDVTDHGFDIHNTSIITTANIGSHDIKFSI